MVTKVRGSFNEFAGTGYLDAGEPGELAARSSPSRRPASTPATPTATPTCGPTTSSTWTTYPEITFTSTAVEQVDAEHYRVTGDLTIKGVTKPVTVDFEYTGAAVDPYGNQRIGFEGTTTVNRKDWGVNWNAALEAGGVLVSEKVTLEFEVSAIRTADAA